MECKYLLLLALILLIAPQLIALPGQVSKPSWDVETDVVSWTEVSGASDYCAQLYKNGTAFGSEISGITVFTHNFHATLIADGTPLDNNNKYTVKVRARDESGYGAYSDASLNNVKGLSNITIKGLNADDNNDGYPIWNTGGATSAFIFNVATLTYTANIRHELRGIFIYFPCYTTANSNNPVSVSNTFNLSTIVLAATTISDSVYTDLEMARHASTDEKNIITIVVNKNNPGFERTYTLNFRRRMGCAVGSMALLQPASTASPLYSITGNTQFSSALTGSNVSFTPGTDAPLTVNGDTTPTYNTLDWFVLAETGTAYFGQNGLLYPLSNGTFKVRAKTIDGTNLNRVSQYSYNITGMSGWAPHLGKLIIRNANILTDTLTINPAFNASLANNTTLNVTAAAGVSSIKISTMVPTDCDLYINDSFVANASDLIVKVKKGLNTFVLKAQNTSKVTCSYTLKVTREANSRLQYGVQTVTGKYPYLSAPDSCRFGLNNSTYKDRMTVEAWVKWTVIPPTGAVNQWANIVTLDRAYQSDTGQFWLQHDVTNTKFEFAVRTDTGRNFVQSRTQPMKDTWYHVAGVYTGKYIKLYVNGVEEASASRTGNINPIAGVSPNLERLWIGRSPSIGTNDPGTRILVGNIRGVALWIGKYKDSGQIAEDYRDTITNETFTPDESPLPDYYWMLNETTGSSGTTVSSTFGSVNLTMQSMTSASFTTGSTTNDNNGAIFTYRPTRMDLRDTSTSQSAILVYAGSFDANAKYILPSSLTSPTYYNVWNPVAGAYQSPAVFGTDSGIPFYHNPSTSTGRFWIPIILGGNASVNVTFVDALTTDYATYHTQIPCSTPTVMTSGSTFDITGHVVGNTQYPTSNKYVVLGYNQTVGGNLISAASTDIAAKGRAQFILASDQMIKRIEIRTLDDILIKSMTNESGWSDSITLTDETLPVELVSFSALCINGQVSLDWTTATETNLLGYYIYKGLSANLYEAEQIPSLIPGTNTSNEQSYSFTDREVTPMTSYYYWLESVDLNSYTEYHGPILVFVNGIGGNPNPTIPHVTQLLKPYPNPFNPVVRLPYSLAVKSPATISIYNTKGQKIRTWNFSESNPGYYNLDWDADDDNNSYPSGVYLIRFQAGRKVCWEKVSLIK